MKHFRSLFYKAIAERLLSINDEQGNSIIKAVDLWNRQFDGDRSTPTNFPAVYLEFKPISWQTTGQHKQAALLEFTLHIANTTKAQAEYNRQFTDRFLGHLELIDTIHYWLTGFNSNNLENIHFGSITRTGSRHDHYHGDILVHQEMFACNIKDESAMRNYQKTAAGLVIDDELILDL